MLRYNEDEITPHGIYEGYTITGKPKINSMGDPTVYVRSPQGRGRDFYIARFIMEMHIGRKLNRWETIRYHDEDKTNVVLSNIYIHNVHEERKLNIKSETFICPICNKEFTLSGKTLSKVNLNKRNKGKFYTGPFCSRECASQYNKTAGAIPRDQQ